MNKYQAAQKYGIPVEAIVQIDNLIIENRAKIIQHGRKAGSMCDAEPQLARLIMGSTDLNEAEATDLAKDRLKSTGNSFFAFKVIGFLGLGWLIYSLFN